MGRNEQYLRDNIAIHKWYIIVGAILGAVPTYIRPLIGPIVALPCRFYQRKINRTLKPLFTERMRFLQNPPKGDIRNLKTTSK
jgi:hypothetical protein